MRDNIVFLTVQGVYGLLHQLYNHKHVPIDTCGNIHKVLITIKSRFDRCGVEKETLQQQ